MAKASWRDTVKKKKKGKSSTSKEAFKEWLGAKVKKSKEIAAKEKLGKGKGKGQRDKSEGKPRRDPDEEGKGDGKGERPEKRRAPESAPAPKKRSPLTVEAGTEQGASKALMERLIEMKQRLLAGNAEAARAGAAKAVPGAFAAERDSDDRKGKGKGKGRGKGDSMSSRAYEKKERAPVEPVDREELVTLNQRIAEYARARDLEGARSALATLEEKGWANGHTYSAAVHALCRCGDWRAAEEALTRAELRGLFRRGPGLVSGLISRTAMMRGFFENARSFVKAKKMLTRIEKEYQEGGQLNTRAANTFLRGCLLFGAVDEALAMLVRMEEGSDYLSQRAAQRKEKLKKDEPKKQKKWWQEDDWNWQKKEKPVEKPQEAAEAKTSACAPDASSYEHVVSLLCQALRHAEATEVAERGLKRLGPWPGSAAMFITAARAAAVRGDAAAASKASNRANLLLEQESKTNVGSSASGGGKRGVERDAEASVARARSLEVFQSHRRSECEAELRDLGRFLKKPTDIDLIAMWSRTLAFEDLISTNWQVSAGTSTSVLVRRLCEAFGLQKGSADAEGVRATMAAAMRRAEAPAEALGPKKKRRKQQKTKPGESKLDLAGLFADEVRPVHLELCSGNGEWLCAQALRDRSASWVACELRFDRSARCFQRFALRGLAAPGGNAALIVGDARDALTLRLMPGSCDRVFINHPEPPHQRELEVATSSSGGGEAEAPSANAEANTHLLTPSFLREACRNLLRPGGTLTICTDCWEYGEWLLNTLAGPGMSTVFEDALRGTKADKESVLSKAGKLALRGKPPPVDICGGEYSGKAGASYFQRLKQSEKGARGEEDGRYFICLRRRDVAAEA